MNFNYKLSTLPLPKFAMPVIANTGLPPVVDMEPHMAPVFNQLQLGSCTGNAFVGALEYLENKAAGFTNTDAAFIGLSRLYVYYNERLLEGEVSQDAGASLQDGIMAIAKYGACKEMLCPYIISQYAVQPSQAAYSDGETRKAVQFSQLDIDQPTFLQTLAAGYPIVIGMNVYSGLERIGSDGLLPMPNPNEDCLGGHAVLVCGYDLSRQLLKVRNSWGAGWGFHGYFWMPFAYAFGGQVLEAAVIERLQ